MRHPRIIAAGMFQVTVNPYVIRVTPVTITPVRNIGLDANCPGSHREMECVVNKGRLTLGGLVSAAAIGAAVLTTAAPALAQTNGVAESAHVTAVSAHQAAAQPGLPGWSIPPWLCECMYYHHLNGGYSSQQPADNNTSQQPADNNTSQQPADNNTSQQPADNGQQSGGLGGLLSNLLGGLLS
jgi:hypothetical protein